MHYSFGHFVNALYFLNTLCGAQTDNIKRLLKRCHHMLDEPIKALGPITLHNRENLELVVKIHSDALRTASLNARLLAEPRTDEVILRLLQLAQETPLLNLSDEFCSFNCEIQCNEKTLNASRLAQSGLIRDYNKT